MKSITVFTPAYNRAYCLHLLYESLVRQTNQDFHWLIIDDGSTDNTEEVVRQWLEEGKISMQYHKQTNKGMVGAHNTAHYMMETELCVCMDSDDFMPDNAIERILALWKEHGYPESAGLVGLDAFKDGKIVGTKLPENVKECKFSELYVKYNVSGDKNLFITERCLIAICPIRSLMEKNFRSPVICIFL
ncbi:glycosyltransferase family 2 protein [Flavobacterium piscinae]|uniref:glycosyltransferase family 2 protein n=1 Tax=Flavobacterium piscinae TaxID=2506424 RepID=UPI002AABFC37|nr:glycosyltransferase family A protein [Flavobacterium piscinae]